MLQVAITEHIYINDVRLSYILESKNLTLGGVGVPMTPKIHTCSLTVSSFLFESKLRIGLIRSYYQNSALSCILSISYKKFQLQMRILSEVSAGNVLSAKVSTGKVSSAKVLIAKVSSGIFSSSKVPISNGKLSNGKAGKVSSGIVSVNARTPWLMSSKSNLEFPPICYVFFD